VKPFEEQGEEECLRGQTHDGEVKEGEMEIGVQDCGDEIVLTDDFRVIFVILLGEKNKAMCG
jgi:hypothetical protein